MNEYKITYSGESEGYRIITDRTEAAAKKFFRETAKELDLGRITIDSVELLSDNAMASKRNERETLETIRQLVADLGPQSYLATAFEGCFEDAESNIENDFGDSMKARWLHADAELNAAKGTIEELEEKLQQEIAERQRARDEAQEFIKKLEAKVLSDDDLEDVRQLLDDRATEADEAATKAAGEIVKYADHPESKEFQQAVINHRNYTREAEYARSILERVVAAQAAAHHQKGSKEAA